MSVATLARICVLLIAGIGLEPAFGHHAFPANYLVNEKIAIEGTVVEFQIRNPHSFIHVMAPDQDGVMQTWVIEWGPGILLAHDDIDGQTLKPGDKVKVTGSPGRVAAQHRMRITTIERTTDHWKWKGAFDCS
jgi:Family of unknown function (DUF6152)